MKHLLAVTFVAIFTSLIHPAPVDAQDRAFITINGGLQAPATADFTQRVSLPSRQETATAVARYQVDTRPTVDIGGTGMVTPRIGIGVAFGSIRSGVQAEASLTQPHPLFFNRPVTRARESSDPARTETAVHLQAVAAVPAGERARVLLFAGPSYLRVKQRLIEDFNTRETLTVPSLVYDFTITGLQEQEVEASGWGFNVGADAAVYFSKHVGLGGMIRVTRGTVQMKNLLEASAGVDTTQDLTLGGTVATGGIRFKF
jgi:hypothetical protein